MKISSFLAFIMMMLVTNLAFAAPPAVPEPDLSALFLVGAAMFGLVKWKNRKKG